MPQEGFKPEGLKRVTDAFIYLGGRKEKKKWLEVEESIHALL